MTQPTKLYSISKQRRAKPSIPTSMTKHSSKHKLEITSKWNTLIKGENFSSMTSHGTRT